MITQFHLVRGAALVVALAACSDSTAVSNGISRDDANQLAADMDAVAALGTSDVGLGAVFSIGVDPGSAASVSVPVTFDNTFNVTRQCPKGGQVVFDGRVIGSGDRATHSLAVETIATRTDTDCAFRTKRGLLTVSGNPNLAFDGKLNIVNGALSGVQTATHKGSFTWARAEISGTCDVDLSSAYDPATHTATVTGKFCGFDVNVTRTR